MVLREKDFDLLKQAGKIENKTFLIRNPPLVIDRDNIVCTNCVFVIPKSVHDRELGHMEKGERGSEERWTYRKALLNLFFDRKPWVTGFMKFGCTLRITSIEPVDETERTD